MQFRMRSTRLVVGSSALVLALGAAGGGPASAAAAPPSVGVPRAVATAAAPDFDGDGRADLVYGVGATQSSVVVAYGSGKTLSFQRTDAGGPAVGVENATGFGRGLLARDLNGDGYSDLVVVDGSQAAGSSLYLIMGSASGLQPGSAHRYQVPAGLYGFMGAPALVESPSRLLAVGVAAPRSVAKGGAIAVYRLGANGLPVSGATVLSQRNLPGADETGDQFGAALAASGNLLLVGAPGEDVGRVKDAGAVTVLRYRGGTSFTGSTVTQNSKGVSGKAEKGDRFGSAVAIADRYAAVGVPFEDGAKRDSGVVATFTVKSSTLKPKASVSQSTKGVPGVSEAGDRFGTSVAVIRACPGVAGILVGAPSEAMGTTAEAGSAWVIPMSKSCAALQLAEGGRLGGTATEMALVGSAVSALRTSARAADTLVITAPGISEEGVYGRVLTLAPPYAAPATTAAAGLHLNEEGTIALSPAG